MTSSTLHVRQYLSLRDAEVGRRRSLVLALVPFDRESRVVDEVEGDVDEVFRPRAFSHLLKSANRTELRYAHDESGAPYGFGQELTEDPQYLIGRFRVAPSERGDQLLSLVEDDQLSGVSVGFFPGRTNVVQPAVAGGRRLLEHLRVRQLREVSLTTAPAYKDARVLAIREKAEQETRISADRERERIRLIRMRVSLD